MIPLQFQSPEWFLLVPVIFLAGWFWKRLDVRTPLRIVIVLLLAVALSDPTLRRQDDALDLYVLLDRSDSTEDLVDNNLPEWKRLLEKAKPSSKDQLLWFNYAAEMAELGADGVVFTGSRKLTRTNLALQNIAAMADTKKPSRVLLFTDGFSTEPLNESIAQLETLGIPLDIRMIREEVENDFRVARLEIPDRMQVGEPYLISVTLRGTSAEGDSANQEIPLTLKRNGKEITTTKVRMADFTGKVEFTDRISQPGSYQYQVEIAPAKDTYAGNNSAARWIEISGGPRVLLATRYPDDPVEKVLRSLNFSVETISDLSALQVGKLSGARAVIFNNVPAHEVPKEFLDAIPFYVEEQGGGFLMIGGSRSFGSGGYFQSSLDPILPISMELKSEHRKLAVALAIVMDRSGSMGVSVAGGKTKMDLANQGAANAIDLLGMQDQVAVFAVDSAPEPVIPMTKIAEKKAALRKRAMSIQSAGGGIYVYEGLKAGWDALKKTSTGTKHIILFTDVADTEEPEDFKRLLKEMTDQGASVSVIGMGTKADSDAKLCEEIAKLGNGRIFFSDKPMDIPKIFAQETVTIARSAFVEEPTGTTATGRWGEISPQEIDWLPKVGGYNLSYAREGSTVALVSQDEYLAPLVASCRRGLGRSAAISFPLAGDHSEQARDWSAYGDFVQTTVRWLMGMDLPPGLALKHRAQGARLDIDLLYDSELWAETFSSSPPKIRLLQSNAETPTAFDVPWRRISPGQFSISREFEEGSIIRGAVQVGRNAVPFGPITLGSSIEWAFDAESLAQLRSGSRQTGGRELTNLADAWLRPQYIHDSSLRLPLFICLLVLILFEALIARTDWKLPVFVSGSRTPKAPKPVKQKAAKVKEPAPLRKVAEILPEPKKEDAAPAVEMESSERRSRFQKAKDRK